MGLSEAPILDLKVFQRDAAFSEWEEISPFFILQNLQNGNIIFPYFSVAAAESWRS
jgi:hypothetical protein